MFLQKVKQNTTPQMRGLSLDLIKHISRSKNEPAWMLKKRIRAFQLWGQTPIPETETALSGIDLDSFKYYVKHKFSETDSWKDVPDKIVQAFDKMGAIETGTEQFGGTFAQFDSGAVYLNIRKEFSDKGIIFESMETAVRKFPELVQKYFMTDCISADDSKFATLNGAVWSGGAFIYIPPDVKIDLPLQTCFRMNSVYSGQFAHTIIVADRGSSVECVEGCSSSLHKAFSLHNGCVEIYVLPGASVKYTSVENLSKSTYSIATRKALVYENGSIEWSGINTGSLSTVLYPESMLIGSGARSESSSVVVAGKYQTQNMGSKVTHAASNTSSIIRSRSISRGGGVSNYNGFVHILPNMKDVTSLVECEALILDDISESNACPLIQNESDEVDIAHEARVGKIGEEKIFYLKSRGFTEEEAVRLVVNGFINPVVKTLPMEHALGFKELIDLEIGGK